MRVFLLRASDLLLGRRRDRELDVEVDAHLSLLAEELIARGVPTERAVAEARRRFGGVDQMKMRYREQRGLPAIDAFRQDFRFALRVLGRDRGFTITAVLVLALGIGVNNMMFTILNAHTIRGLPLEDVDRVVYVSTRDAADTDRGVSWPDFDDLRGAVGSVDLAAFTSGPTSLGEARQAPDRVERSYITVDTFSVLGIEPFLGRVLTAEDDEVGAPPVALLSERAWRRRYGADPSIVGRTVLVDGLPATIVAIVQSHSGFPATADLWQPIGQMRGLQRETRSARVLRVVGRVKPGATVASAGAEIDAVATRLSTEHPDSNTGVRTHVVPINERFLGRLQDPAWLAFMAVGCLVALISCANVANLLLGRALTRDREIALRSSLGATRGRIVRQLLMEAVVLAVAGGLVGLAVGVAGVGLFRQGIPADVLPYWMDYAVDGRVVTVLLVVAASATLVFGLVPALQASRPDPQAVLRQGGPTVARTKRASRWTTLFLVTELALGFVMLSNLALAWRLAGVALPTDAALRADDVMTSTVALPVERYPDQPARLAFLRGLAERLAATPGVGSLAFASTLPVRPAPERRVRALDGQFSDPLVVRQVLVSPDYFAVLGVSVSAGRALLPGDGRPANRGAVVNERLAAKLFPTADPLGQRFGFVESASDQPVEWLTVVGVVPAIRQRPSAEPEAIAYVPIETSAPAMLSMLVRTTAGPEPSAALLRDAVFAIDAHLPLYSVATLRQAIADAEWNGRVSSRLLLSLTAIAIGLAAVGLYAVMGRIVGSRRREIGIRVAVGATPGQVRSIVLRQALWHVAIGSVMGVLAVVAWEVAFTQSARAGDAVPAATLADPIVLIAIAGVVAAIAIAACVGPVRRAQAVSPSLALGHD